MYLLSANPAACVIRASWLFGYGGEHFPSKMLHLMRSVPKLKIIDDQMGRPTFCEDLAKVSIKMLNKSGIYHFANQGQASWFGYAKWMHQFFIKSKTPISCKQIDPVNSLEYPTKAIRPKYSVLSTKKIEDELDFTIRNWMDCVKEYYSQAYGIDQ